jgi:hypothetical protein
MAQSSENKPKPVSRESISSGDSPTTLSNTKKSSEKVVPSKIAKHISTPKIAKQILTPVSSEKRDIPANGSKALKKNTSAVGVASFKEQGPSSSAASSGTATAKSAQVPRSVTIPSTQAASHPIATGCTSQGHLDCKEQTAQLAYQLQLKRTELVCKLVDMRASREYILEILALTE